MIFINLGIIYIVFGLSFLTSMVRPYAWSIFIPDFWPAILILITLQFNFIHGFLISILFGYLLSVFSILPASFFFFMAVFTFIFSKLFVVNSNWKELSTLTILGAAVSVVTDLSLLISAKFSLQFYYDWKAMLISMPIRALINATATFLAIKYLANAQSQREVNEPDSL